MPLTNSLCDMNSTLRIRVTLALILIFFYIYALENESITCIQVYVHAVLDYFSFSFDCNVTKQMRW